ncbi:DUF2487 family protein [Paenibacillus crassostreae]|uniref:DUF2487 domain-containing protein n=1 Tax=Paenibacillus crassostreae TaxID=1763538 RepID=A0A162KVB8_9BACL|nr:DUF2487 family protein [Paenibacillus crassostreae]AOZ91328.1 hypothetical protein LPB68_03330 [Paenibacillus crassostreae]OAB74513.1 hypothetical protein PNBC_10630 [Paenibacillus crassostreae]
MKFSEISSESWLELQPYLDTCIIPFTGLKGVESPIEATAALERLRDLLDLVENRYRGRTITYPAFHYDINEKYELVNELCHKIKKSGFKYVIIVTADTYVESSQCPYSDLVLSQPLLEKIMGNEQLTLTAIVQNRIERLWMKGDPL